MKRLIPLFMMAICGCAGLVQAAPYVVARHATPVLSSPAFDTIFGGRDGRSLKTDRCGQVREMEFIALPGTVFKILGETKSPAATIYQVETDDYPSPTGKTLYVDSRFIDLHQEQPSPRVRKLPGRERIIAALRDAGGSPYVWGGNMQGGVPGLEKFFYRNIPEKERSSVTLAGLDCSGLLYQATGGWTPRNTSQLLSFGTAVPVEGQRAEDIARSLQPLDLIVWNGHVIIVLDHETVIESRLECGRPGNGGVVTTPLVQRLREVMRTRRPANRWPVRGKQQGVFVVRRWMGL
jgi:hypothetical protein